MIYPLRFQPILKRYLWGGRRLGTVLHKQLGPEADFAESWEIVDRPDEMSVVWGGPLAGNSLHELIRSQGEALLGTRLFESVCRPEMPASLRGRFPLLLKFLDASQTLSVQVHPDDRLAARLVPPDLGKTEAWYVLDAPPGSVIYAGLKHGVTADQLRAAADDGSAGDLLHPLYPRAGDCVLVPAGTVHAIGAGILLVEIQQNSNATFRLFDWNRVDSTGRPRPLHIDWAIEATDFGRGPVNVCAHSPLPQPGAEQLVDCDRFRMNRWTVAGGQEVVFAEGMLRLICVVDGAARISGDPVGRPLLMGESMLIPACLEGTGIRAQPECRFLEITPPASLAME